MSFHAAKIAAEAFLQSGERELLLECETPGKATSLVHSFNRLRNKLKREQGGGYHQYDSIIMSVMPDSQIVRIRRALTAEGLPGKFYLPSGEPYMPNLHPDLELEAAELLEELDGEETDQDND